MNDNHGEKTTISIRIIRTTRRTLALRVTADGHVEAHAPLTMSDDEILTFARSRSSWIKRHVDQRRATNASAPQPYSREELERIRQHALQLIPQRVAHLAPLVGVTYGRVTIRFQRTRWGSCTYNGNLNFNALLAEVEPELLDYVIVHELCHRKQMNHSSKFWAEVQKVCPEWQQCRRKLKDSHLLSRIPAKEV